jgi:predicted ATP-dependent endonuclease of OLD family
MYIVKNKEGILCMIEKEEEAKKLCYLMNKYDSDNEYSYVKYYKTICEDVEKYFYDVIYYQELFKVENRDKYKSIAELKEKVVNYKYDKIMAEYTLDILTGGINDV